MLTSSPWAMDISIFPIIDILIHAYMNNLIPYRFKLKVLDSSLNFLSILSFFFFFFFRFQISCVTILPYSHEKELSHSQRWEFVIKLSWPSLKLNKWKVYTTIIYCLFDQWDHISTWHNIFRTKKTLDRILFDGNF